MKKSLRPCFSLAALASCAWLAGAPRAEAAISPGQIELNQVVTQARFVNMLLGKTNAVIAAERGLVNQENNLVQQQRTLASQVPGSPGQALSILDRLNVIGHQISTINRQLTADNALLSSDLFRTSQAIANLNKLMPVHPNVAVILRRFENNANTAFGQAAAGSSGLLNRPPATPFVGSLASDVLGLSNPRPIHHFHRHRVP